MKDEHLKDEEIERICCEAMRKSGFFKRHGKRRTREMRAWKAGAGDFLVWFGRV